MILGYEYIFVFSSVWVSKGVSVVSGVSSPLYLLRCLSYCFNCSWAPRLAVPWAFCQSSCLCLPSYLRSAGITEVCHYNQLFVGWWNWTQVIRLSQQVLSPRSPLVGPPFCCLVSICVSSLWCIQILLCFLRQGLDMVPWLALYLW